MYQLTDEGKKYLKKGLPERRLYELVKDAIPIKDAQKMIDDFSIGLMWAKKNGWVKIEKGIIVREGVVSDTDAEKGLKLVSEGKTPPDKIASLLLDRNIIKKDKTTALTAARELIGKSITALTPELIKTGLWKEVNMKPYNVEAAGKTIYPGKRQPYAAFINEIKNKLLELGFVEMTGPTIELEFWNFDSLFQAQNHPSRSWTETYSIKGEGKGTLPKDSIIKNVRSAHENGGNTGSTGWGYKWDEKKASKIMPRAHDTAISPRYLSGHSGNVKVPGKYFSLVRCYRPDVIDATHGVEFNQCGGFIIDENLSFRNLLGVLKDFVMDVTEAEDVKFYPDYYPFTEPSVQISAKHPELGWVELAGAGVFRPELTEPLGVKQPVIAWGFGIDRLAMYKLGIKDIRYLFSDNIKWLREKTVM
ncbi:MAG: phenylalanine--tRNA ligase subunit alpha [Candidatus Aenigmarchaeota archaeon]|nr:phenylalanine--tRNA ligase subunit alpha [Candidatus Aenigmarchaeota archaeon]